MAEKIFNTRIQLKYDTYANWTTANTELKTGEVAVVQIPGQTYTKYEGDKAITVQNPPHILFKVGPGNFNDLDWTSAKAADVYAWAKAKTVVYEGQHIKFKGAADEDLLDLDLEEFVTASELEAITGDLTQLNTQNKKDLVTAINEALQAVEVGGTGSVVTVVKEATPTTGSSATYTVKQGGNAVGDKIEIPDIDTGVHAVVLEGGTSDGTLKLTVDEVSTDNIKVTGLEDAAYTTVASLNETAKGYADAVEAQLPTSADYGVLKVAAGTGIEVGGTDQNPTVSVKANTYDAYGAASAVKDDVVDGTIKAKDAENADTAEHADAATKVDKAITVKVGGADVVFDGSAAKTVDVDEAIAAGVAEAKDYADEHDANTEYHIEYDSTNKKIKLVAGADAKKMEIDATDFIKDGMIESVELVQEDGDGNEGQFLKLTWNDDGKDVTYVPVGELVDVYTGSNGETVNVSISNKNVVSASVHDIKDAHIASNAAIAKSKLATDVQNSLAKADSALQSHQDLSNYKTKQDAVTSKGLTGANVLSSLSQNENGEISYETRTLTCANIGAEAAGTAQRLIDALNVTNITGMGADKTLATLSETEGKISATFQDIEITHSQVSDFNTAVAEITADALSPTTLTNITDSTGTIDDTVLAEPIVVHYEVVDPNEPNQYTIQLRKRPEYAGSENVPYKGLTEDYLSTDVVDKLDNKSLNNTVTIATETDDIVSIATVVKQTNGLISAGSTSVTLAAVAKTGNVKDLTQTNGDILVFNCGTASTVI